MPTANILNLFDTLLASWLMAITFLHANPHIASTVMNVNGQATTVRRYQTAQLIRTMVILFHVGDALRNGSMATWRGVLYFTISQVGKKIKGYFSKDVKRVCNTLNLPKHLLCKSESTAMAHGDLRIKNIETGVVINLLELSVLDDSILRSSKFEILHKGEGIDKVIVIEKRTIYHRMVEAGFDKTMNAILLTDMGFPSLQGKAWLRLIMKALNISDDKCYGVGDYGPIGWEVLHSYYFVKNPIECENVYNTNLKIVITPAFMTNFSEVKNTENTAFTDADKKIFKFLANPENKFKRFDQLKKMYVRQFKCDLDLLDFQKLLKAIEYAIDRDYVI